MDYSILKEAKQVEPYVKIVNEEADKNRTAFGFLNCSVYVEASLKNCLWILIIDDEYAGHVMFSLNRKNRKITIIQTLIINKYRKKGLAALLIEELVRWGDDNDFYYMRASVATDLDEANYFYNKLGFKALRVKDGGKTTKRKINVRQRIIKNPGLLNFMDRPKNKVNFKEKNVKEKVVIDTNIVKDLVDNREFCNLVSDIFKNALRSKYPLFVTEEFEKEIKSSSKFSENDPLENFLKVLPVLSNVPDSILSPVVEKLEVIVFNKINSSSKSAKNKKSDLRHIGYTICNNCDVFITRDKELLKASDNIFKEYGVDILSPIEFINNDDFNITNEELVLDGFSLLKTKLQPVDQDKLFFECNELCHLKSIITELSGFKLSDDKGRDLGVVIYPDSLNRNGVSLNIIVILRESSNSEIILDNIYTNVLNFLKTRDFGIINVYLNSSNEKLCSFFECKNFVLNNCDFKGFNLYKKFFYTGIITKDSWSCYVSSFNKCIDGINLPIEMPSYKKMINDGLLYNSDCYMSLSDFESMSLQTIFMPDDRGVAVVPVKYRYIRELFLEVEQNAVFPLLNTLPKPEAFLRSENVYFRSSLGSSSLKEGMIILFYSSGVEKAIVGLAKVTFSKTISIDEAYDLSKKYGVYEFDKIKKTAGNKDIVHVIGYDNFYYFSSKAKYDFLKDIGVGKNNFQTISFVNSEQFKMILKKSGI